MAAKNVREAILLGLTINSVYLSEKQTRRLEGELRDFFALQIMDHLGRMPSEREYEAAIRWKEEETTLTSFFNKIFKNISSYQGGEDE